MIDDFKVLLNLKSQASLTDNPLADNSASQRDSIQQR